MASRRFVALIAATLACLHAASALSEPLQIVYAELFQPQSIRTPGAQKVAANTLRVRAFGGDFELTLEDNSRLLRYAPPQARSNLSTTRLFKGAIRNVPGSWVRLTAKDGVYSGAIWDGNELYAVQPHETIDEALLTPLSGAAGGSAIYRLSDTRGGALQGVCGLDASAKPIATAPLAKYRSLVNELQAAVAAAASEIEVSMIADFEFTTAAGGPAINRMLSHVNVVDGIFSEQVGVAIVATDFVTFTTNDDPFVSSNAATLLSELASYRESTPAVRSRGLAHLLTGRQLSGDIVGIAFLGSLCVARQGVSLSESSHFIDTPLIMAHELGHNFGAPHDGEPGSACSNAASSFLMGAFLNGSSTFSNCSLQQMQPIIDGASCILPARNRDVSVTVPNDTAVVAPNQPFDFVADVASIGSDSAVNVLANVTLPDDMQRLSLTAPDLDCAFTTEGVSCQAAELPNGETRRITVRLSSDTERQVTVSANVSSTNDSNATNDNAATQVTVAIPRDFQITVAPQPITVVSGEPFEMTFDVTSTASRTLNDVRVEITNHEGLRTTAASIDGGTCAVTDTQPMVVCTLPTLAQGATQRMRATLVSNRIYSINSPAYVRAYENGSATGQRQVEFFINTDAAHDVSVTTTSPIGQPTVIGAEAVWALNVRSAGLRAVDNVTVRFQWIGADASVSIDPPLGPTCTAGFYSLLCSFGTMQPGEERALTLRGRVNESGDLRIDILADSTQRDDRFIDNRLSVGIQARLGDDVQVLAFNPTHAPIEGRDHVLNGSVIAAGVNASQNVVMTATLPVGFVARQGVIEGGACRIEAATPNIIVCTVQQIPPNERRLLGLRYAPGAPGVYDGALTVTASADSQPANNSAAVTWNVAPNVDGELLFPPEDMRLRTDLAVELPFTIRNSQYTLPDARVEFSWSQLTDVTITAPGATCVSASTGHSCAFGALPPNSSVPFSVRMRPTTPPLAFLTVRLVSPADVDAGNNSIFYTLRVFAPGDAEIVVPLPVANVIERSRSTFLFDLNVTTQINEALLELEFDSTRIVGASVDGYSCEVKTSGLACVLGAVEPPRTTRFTLRFAPEGLGATPITVRIRSANDANPANDAQTTTVTIVAAPPPPASPGGGGGGGPMSWPLALALALLLMARVRPTTRARHSS